MKRGANRERQIRIVLERKSWWVARAAGSLGDADLVALKRGEIPRLIEVKSTARPYERFEPEKRERLRRAADKAGAIALLAWWPSRGELTFIPASEWPISGKNAVIDPYDQQQLDVS